MKGKEISLIEFITLVALLMALVSATINMLLPAFQNITTDFQLKDKNQIQLSISLLYLGLGVSQLFYGALSDSIGRKTTIYIGLALFILGCVISYQSNNLNTLLLGQIIQGLGLGAPRVMSVAIVRDKFEGNQMAKAMSFIMAIYILIPTVSPILGKSIIMVSTWRILFVIYIVFGLIIFLLFKNRMPETLTKEKQKSFTLKYVIKAVGEILKKKFNMLYYYSGALFGSVYHLSKLVTTNF